MEQVSFTTEQVARILKVHPRVVARWCARGLIPSSRRPGRSSHWFIPKEAVEKAAAALMEYRRSLRERIPHAKGTRVPESVIAGAAYKRTEEVPLRRPRKVGKLGFQLQSLKERAERTIRIPKEALTVLKEIP